MDPCRLSSLEEEACPSEERAEYTKDGSVDVKGNPALRHSTGSWKSGAFVLVTEWWEQLTLYGIQFNLVTFLTTQLHQSNVEAAKSFTTWQGTYYFTPIVGAILADSYIGRYWTIVAFFTMYIIGTGAMTLSASAAAMKAVSQPAVFFVGLYMMAIGSGCIKSCIGPFGADQFDSTDPAERLAKNSYFNWFNVSIYIGGLVAGTCVVWVQDNHGWVLGFGIPALSSALAVASFLLGSKSYRHQKPRGSPVIRMCQVIVAAVRKWNVTLAHNESLLHELPDNSPTVQGLKLLHTTDFRFLDKAAAVSSTDEFSNPWRLCTVTQVEELKIIIRMLPMWVNGIIIWAVLIQFPVFLEQGQLMNKRAGAFTISPASLNSIYSIAIIILVILYDRMLLPIARRITGNERGISELQRMGIGRFLTILTMVVAALVETKRLEIARAHSWTNQKKDEAAMSILWQVPQYFLLGACIVFAFVGQLEFFYNEAPDSMRSLCSALGHMTVSLGGYLCSFVVTIVSYFTTKNGGPGWIADDLNDGHLDRFFWLLAVIGLFNLVVFMWFASRYKCKNSH